MSNSHCILASHSSQQHEYTIHITGATHPGNPGNDAFHSDLNSGKHRLAESRRSWRTLRPHRLCLRRLRACYNECVQSELVYIEAQVTTNVYESSLLFSPQRKSRLRYAVLRSLASPGLISPGHRISISAVTSIKPGSEHWLAACITASVDWSSRTGSGAVGWAVPSGRDIGLRSVSRYLGARSVSTTTDMPLGY